MDDPSRRDLHCTEVFGELFGTRAQAGQFVVTVRGSGNTRLFTSVETFATRNAALNAARPLEFRMRRPEIYEIDASAGTGAVVLRLTGGGTTLTNRAQFDTEADAVAAARAILDRHNMLVQSDMCDSEGMHLIEHILLRPRRPGDRLMQVCLSDECTFCGEEDPYSFRVSIVLPYWPERFQDLNFRRFGRKGHPRGDARPHPSAYLLDRQCGHGDAGRGSSGMARSTGREARGRRCPFGFG